MNTELYEYSDNLIYFKKEDLLDSNVHIHTIKLNLLEEVTENLKKILFYDEIERAERFVFERHKKSFIISHAVLRKILGNYLDISPSLIRFDYAEYGKPAVSADINSEKISFSLSHSQDMAAVAVAKYFDIGVDIEYLRPIKDMNMLAKRFFSVNEYYDIISCSEKEGIKTFFDIWTRKEAYLKATGEGVSGLEYLKENPFFSSDWDVQNFTPANGYRGAVAMKRIFGNINI